MLVLWIEEKWHWTQYFRCKMYFRYLKTETCSETYSTDANQCTFFISLASSWICRNWSVHRQWLEIHFLWLLPLLGAQPTAWCWPEYRHQGQWNRQMNEYRNCGVCMYTMEFSLKERKLSISYDIGETWGHYAKWIKPERERKILHSTTYMRNLKKCWTQKQRVEWWFP